jgi:hypothetical protein
MGVGELRVAASHIINAPHSLLRRAAGRAPCPAWHSPDLLPPHAVAPLSSVAVQPGPKMVHHQKHIVEQVPE